MTLLVVGESLGVTERQAGSPGNQWTERVLSVFSRDRVERIRLAREFRGAEPVKGEYVAVECSVRAYARYDKRSQAYSGEAGHDFTGYARVDEVERLLSSDVAAV